METKIPFSQFIETAFDQGDYSTDDVIAFVLPLFKEVLGFHEDGLTAPFENKETLSVNDHVLDIDESFAHAPVKSISSVTSLFEQGRSKNFDIVGNVRVDVDVDQGTKTVEDLQIHLDTTKPMRTPAYIPGYQCFEMLAGHHDDLTDIFCLGLVLGSMSLSLDLYDESDFELFVNYRKNPAYYNNRIHPTISTLITEMTELNRSRRSQDLYDVISRLENYRDFDGERQVDLTKVAGWKTKEIISKGQYILSKLRNRLFDTSRRNRLLYYKPNMRFVNLTVSSVPMVLHYQSIRPELLFTWNAEISGRVRDMKEIVLNKYLRFEDHQYLGSSLDKIRTEAQHDIQEYGFSQLKLVIAFLNWHNLKDDKNERIQSPLLLIPVELKKNKKLKEDHYVMRILANEAEINPVLSNQLRELYGIQLPDFIDLDDTTLESFFKKLKEQIDHANQGIVIHYIDKPRIKIVHSVARQTVSNYKKRLRRNKGISESYKNLSYSYQYDSYKPLGLEIFRQYVEPKATMLEFLINDEIKISSHQLTGDKERQLYEIVESEENPYSWDFDVCNIVLGNFNYKKMSLVRDYNKVIDEGVPHHVFEHLFSEEPKRYADYRYDLNIPEPWYHVIAADPTQTKAILQARTTESYIIQGPPGTGKSQTITNLIADFTGQGKSVLFVCEKRAALDVVFHRLKQQGLDELCCYIHDSQGDKREFVKNLKSTYEDFIKQKADLQKIEKSRAAVIEKLVHHLSIIRDYHLTNSNLADHGGIELRKLIERLIELKPHLTNLSKADEELLPHYLEWQQCGVTIDELSRLLEESAAAPGFAEHPFNMLRDAIFLHMDPQGQIAKLVRHASGLLEEISVVYKNADITSVQMLRFSSMKALVEDAVLLYPLAETGNIKLVDFGSIESREFEQDYKLLKDLRRQLVQSTDENKGWNVKLSETDAQRALQIAEQNEKSFFSFFNGDWRKLKKTLNQSYNFSSHQVRPKYVQILTQLIRAYALQKDVSALEYKLEQKFGLLNLDMSYVGIERIRSKKGDPEVDFLIGSDSSEKLIRALYGINSTIWQLEACLTELLLHYDQKTITELKDDLENIEANLDNLPDLLPSLKKYARFPEQMKRSLRTLPLAPKQMEAAMANKTLRHFYQHKKHFENSDGQTIEHSALQLKNCYNDLLKLNAAIIRARARTNFLNHLDLSNMALSQLNPEQRVFKKEYTEGRKILENEFGKSMRFKSIRDLAAKESGQVLKDLKPIWLMSPLSVSDSLPVDTSYFDVVIFDEASQITLEEGVPALYRAPQTIIVGDERQMPPTNFFSAKAEDPDDLDTADTGIDDLLNNDTDSLLSQGSRKMKSVMLGWHYRSRYETLISYSNHAFYEADLLTIPDQVIHHKDKQDIEVSQPAEAVKNTDAIFDRSISFHFQTNSVYEKRSNAGEAEYIAGLVCELLKRKVNESIGIVAFSQEQQQTIEDALSTLAATDKEFEQLLEEAYNRTENDQYVGLIVKNLENIQGDERDIIIMSICYGPDSRKKMIMNFGPINKKGGEKRLNVIFSRAKKHMAIVSSIHHHQITNEYNEGASYFRRFLHYAEEVSRGNMKMARTILDSLILKKEKVQSNSTSIVAKEIKQVLVARGYQVMENIGQSGFKCSLAIVSDTEPDKYSLSILIDDDLHYSNENLMEQYYQRPEILRVFGWKTITVFAKDWLHHPSRVIEQIIKRMQEEEPVFVGTESLTEDRAKLFVENKPDPTLKPAGAYDHLQYVRLISTEGGSSKFWEVAVDQQKLVVRFGKIGTRGQTQIKTFEDEDRAVKEKEKMIREKLSKGYTNS
ncbi:AAA domain-containing protein [Pollutibacter soli]|uniref:AAA domain-containing protein n=1 Tax=Pollutibacter soli TaxID=3034157 RepID=UPI003013833A